MIELKKIPHVKENVEFLKAQLIHFRDKLAVAEEIVPQDNTVEEEKANIKKQIDFHIQKLPVILEQIEDIKTLEDIRKIDTTHLVERLLTIDDITYKLRGDVEAIVKKQFKCSLENYVREVRHSIKTVVELFDYIVPSVKNEIEFLRKFYRIPSNAANTILPELEDLILNLENNKITLRKFMDGYVRGAAKVDGYNTLRTKNDVFSIFQDYEKSQEEYDKINYCVGDICKTIWPFLSEQRAEPDFAKLFSQIEEINRIAGNPKLGKNVLAMKDIFQFNYIFKSLIVKVGKKYSYRDEYKSAKEKVKEFNELQKSIISYHKSAFEEKEKELSRILGDDTEKTMFGKVIDEVKRYMEDKTLSFERLEMIFEKLSQKNFNIVVQEKDADDLTIQITPHLSEKFGEDNLKKINIIILEIDFWFPHEAKQLMFAELAETQQKIQADEPVDTKKFLAMVKDFDSEINTKYRVTYAEQIKALSDVVTEFQKIFGHKRDQQKLNSRFMDKLAWEDTSSRLLKVKRNLAVLGSSHASIASNINKFPFLKGAMEELCQLLYDLSMRLFITYDLADQRSITNMTNILSIFNEFHDIKSLRQVFPRYFKQSVIANFYSNETSTIRLTNDFNCKTELNKLFKKKE